MKDHAAERDLALFIEGDLAGPALLDLQGHLKGCERCEAVRRDLQKSQDILKFLANEPLADDALARVRARVLEAADNDSLPRTGRPIWAWIGAAASVAVLALAGLLLLRESQPTAPPLADGRGPTASPAPRPTTASNTTALRLTTPEPAPPRSVAFRAVEPSGLPGKSTTVAPRVVSPEQGGMERVPKLSKDEAEQLARAVVQVSRITQLPDGSDPVEAIPSESGHTLVRLTTADPDIVIYWQLDANGG